MNASAEQASTNRRTAGDTTADFDLHGIVGLRLIGAGPHEIRAVTRQVGPIRARLARAPDIVIRFVDRLQTTSRLRLLGLDEAGFTDDAFLVLRSKHKARTRVQIPFERIGEPCEIICERGLPAVPLLVAIVNLTALARGALPLHASAFTYAGVGVLSTGWAKGGKTESLLGFMALGADYVGDEWVYLSGDGHSMYGIPEPIRLWDWHLREMPRYRAMIGRGDRLRLAALRLAAGAAGGIAGNGRGRAAPPRRFMRRLLPLIERQRYVHLPPHRAFGTSNSALRGELDKVFLVASHDSPEITVAPVAPEEIARRMVFSLQEEQADLMAYYLKFRFAFPERRNPLLDQIEAVQRQALLRVLKGKDAYVVFHPYPVSIPALCDAMRHCL